MNYTWKITGIKKKSVGDTADFVYQVYWSKTGTNSEGVTGYCQGAFLYEEPDGGIDSDAFISFEDLTEEVVLSWVKSQIDSEDEDAINNRIDRDIEMSETISEESRHSNFTSTLPWS
jgi:hypothetical protein